MRRCHNKQQRGIELRKYNSSFQKMVIVVNSSAVTVSYWNSLTFLGNVCTCLQEMHEKIDSTLMFVH